MSALPEIDEFLPKSGRWTTAIAIKAMQDYAAAAVAAERADAERYRWLRERLQMRSLVNAAGTAKTGLEFRIGQTYLNTPTRGRKCYLDPTRFDSECEALDAAIDAAMKGAA